MKKITALILIFLFCIPIALPSCSAADTTACSEILLKLTESEISLPAGKIYDMKAHEGDDEYLPQRLFVMLFGNGKIPSACDGWLDAALFLSLTDLPCEFAVILCNSPDNATDTARLLISRLDAVRTVKGDGKFADMLDSAKVTIIRNYVLLIISSDIDNALKAASKLIK